MSKFAAQEKSEREKRKKRDKKKEREKENIEERKRKKLKKYGEVDKRAVRSVAYWAYASRQCVQRITVVAVGKGAGGLVAVAYRGYRPAAVAA